MIKTIAVGFTPVPKKSEAERRISNFENCGVIDSENVDDKKSQDPEKAPELKQDQNSIAGHDSVSCTHIHKSRVWNNIFM